MKSFAAMTVCVTLIGFGASGCSPAATPVAPAELKQRESMHAEISKKEQEKHQGAAAPSGAHGTK